MHYYPRFNGQVDGSRMSKDIERSLKRTIAWEAVMRIRASSGVRVTNFYGNFFIRGNDLLALPNCDEDASFGVVLGHEQQMIATQTAVVQAALLYTSTDGERRIRVMTSVLPVTSQPQDILEHLDQDAFCNLVSKIAATRPSSGFDAARRYIQGACVDVLRANSRRGGMDMGMGGMPPMYGQQQQQQQQQQSAALPKSAELVPLYTMAMQKNRAFRGGNSVSFDERAAIIQAIARMPIEESKTFFHPKLFSLISMPNDCGRLVAKSGDDDVSVHGSEFLTLGDQRLKLPPSSVDSTTTLIAGHLSHGYRMRAAPLDRTRSAYANAAKHLWCTES